LKKHLGVWWEWLEDPCTKEVYLKATMPKMLQEVKKAYADATGNMPRSWAMLGYPGRILCRATNEEENGKVLSIAQLWVS